MASDCKFIFIESQIEINSLIPIIPNIITYITILVAYVDLLPMQKIDHLCKNDWHPL